MLLRAGGGTFRKLSIPRDSFAAIPGHDPQKINAAYALDDTDDVADQGNTSLMVETVENFLGVDVDHVVLVDFEGFKNFIDAIGGVEVDLPDKLLLGDLGRRGERRLHEALRPGRGDARRRRGADPRAHPDQHLPPEGGLGRVRQLRRPRSRRRPAGDPVGHQGPADEPAAAADQLPQGPDHRLDGAPGDHLRHGRADDAAARARGGDRRRQRPGAARALGRGAGGSLIIPQEECQQAVEQFLDGDPPRTPECSPG